MSGVLTVMKDRIEFPFHEKIRFFGRCADRKELNARFFNWSGSGFTFSFVGSEVRCRLLGCLRGEDIPDEASRAYIAVFIDDFPRCTARFPIVSADGWYTLAEGLPCKHHTVRVIKDTEAGYGRAAVAAVETDGCFADAPALRDRRIEFIGDSITCGYGNLCSNASPDFTTAEESFVNTYAFYACEALDCEAEVVAASGNGFHRDYGCNSVNLIPELYEYTDKLLDGHLGMPAERWNFSRQKCDMIVMKLGQNDFQYCSGADLADDCKTEQRLQKRRAEFESSVRRFFTRILEARRGIPILLIYESDMGLKKELLSGISGLSERVKLLEIKPKRDYEGVGANGHYSVCTHARVGLLVAERIRELL